MFALNNKILVIALGGTIGSVRKSSISLDKNNLKILDYCKRENVEFEGISPFSVLSENMSIALWKRLIGCLNNVDFNNYNGIIILHGSDTLSYTASVIANVFCGRNIVLTASDRPVEDKQSNAVENFNNAVDLILSGTRGVFVSYDGIYKADCISGADCNDKFLSIEKTLQPIGKNKIYDKNILIIHSYPGMSFNSYKTDDVDCVLINMFHSATVPENAQAFCTELEEKGVPYYFVTHKSSADYETAQNLKNIIFNCTIENAFARMLLTK